MATIKKTENWFLRPIIAKCRSKYCRMLQGEHSAILLTCIKLPFVIKTFVLSIFEWSVYTRFTVLKSCERFKYPSCDVLANSADPIRIHHECEIEKSVLRITDWHHEVCHVMPNGDPRDGFFYPILT